MKKSQAGTGSMVLLTPGFAVAVLLVILGVTTVGVAHKDAGAIVGLVRDSSGAVVTGAKVTVTDVERGIQLTFTTNDAGEYVASPLRIGRYTVTVEKHGFKKEVAWPGGKENNYKHRGGWSCV